MGRERDPIFLRRGERKPINEKHFYPPRVLLLLFSLTKNDDLRDSHYFNTHIIYKVHVDGVGPFGLQRRPRGLFRVSSPQERVSAHERDPGGSGPTERRRGGEDFREDRETHLRPELGGGEEERREGVGLI